jgi:hypothetical protein
MLAGLFFQKASLECAVKIAGRNVLLDHQLQQVRHARGNLGIPGSHALTLPVGDAEEAGGTDLHQF